MVEIVVTICDFQDMVNIGTDLIRSSAIIEIPDKSVPKILKEYLENKNYKSVSFSLLEKEI